MLRPSKRRSTSSTKSVTAAANNISPLPPLAFILYGTKPSANIIIFFFVHDQFTYIRTMARFPMQAISAFKEKAQGKHDSLWKKMFKPMVIDRIT